MTDIIKNVVTPEWWAFIVVSACTVVGILEWLKACPPLKDKAPSWIWWAAMPVVCIVVACISGGSFAFVATNAAAMTALCELCYGALIKKIKATIPDKG